MPRPQHGDLLDLIRLHTGGTSLRHAMEEALAFLSLPPSTPANGGDHAGGYDREEAARRLWRRCRPIDGTHAEAYLHARAIGYCRFPVLRFHPDLIHRDDNGIHRLPALVAAVTGNDGAVEGIQRTWLDPKRPGKADLARPRKALGRVHSRAVRFGGSAPARPCLPVRVSKPFYRWSLLSPAFKPPQLYQRAVSAPSNRPKTSPCWSSPGIKMWKAGTLRTVLNAAVGNAAFPQL